MSGLIAITGAKRSFFKMILVAAAALFSVSAFSAGPAHQAMPVSVVVAKKTDVGIEYEYPARTKASQQVSVVAQVSGILEKKLYKDGDKVTKGQLLYQIDPRRYQAKVYQAKAQVGVEEAKLQQAQREYKRVKGLYKNKAVSEQELDTALSNLELAKAGLQGAKAALSDATIDLDYASVRAEISGYIGQKQQDVGSLVGTSADNSVLTTITNLNTIYVDFAIPDNDMNEQRELIANGQLKLPENNQYEAVLIDPKGRTVATGKVDFTDSKIDPLTGGVKARAIFDNQDKKVLPGEFVRIRLVGAKRLNVFSIPQKAVLQIGQQSFVYVVKDGKAKLMPIQIARGLKDQWLVDGGLKEGDQVIINNLIKLRPDTPVMVMPAKPAQAHGKK
ncbi:MAG: efflux RND transporter periplasmic adaptor subunit [Hydrogenovibrio sp.]|nr:efflux RND transporter periplasmic adaptor subunit [Hydrogenovibrio sp.]